MVADECKLQQEPNPIYRWNKKGITPVISVKRNKRKNKSIYGGLSLNLKKVFTHFCDWQNSDETIRFLEVIKKHWNKQTIKTKKRILLVWDNASWHRSKQVRDWLTDNPGVIELMNFPPYHPELNPQEHVWKAMKQYLARLKRDEQADFDRILVKAKWFLKSKTFDYKFV